MATWTFAATDLRTGKNLADSIPLNVQSCSMQLNGTGQLSGSLDLSQDYASNTPFTEALEPRRTVLWCLADSYPVWNGIVWDWPDMSRAQGTLPISAQTMDSLWGKRLITDTIEYPATDLFTAFLDLLQYGLTKNSAYISSVSPPATRPAAYLAYVMSNGGVAGLNLPQGAAAVAGVPWTASYTWSDLAQVSSAWSDMVSAGTLEYVFQPGLDASGNLATFVRLGFASGRSYPQAGYGLSYPGNVTDYGYQRTGSQGANVIFATAPPNGAELQWQSVWPHGADLADLNEGYPLMEATVSWEGSNVTSQAQVSAFADGQVPLYSQAMTSPALNVGGDSAPAIQDIVLGDTIPVALTSALHPPGPGGVPGLQQLMRVTSWTAYPPGPQQSEYIQLQCSAIGVPQPG